MKVIFEHLNKTLLLTSAYRVIKDDIEEKNNTKINPLTAEQITEISNLNEIGAINGVPLNIKFKGNYVEFDDKLASVYINLLYKMKINSPYFVGTMREDFIIEFEYRQLRKEIDQIEETIDESRDILISVFEHLIKTKKFVEEHPESYSQLHFQTERLNIANDDLIHNVKTLTDLRIKKIIDIFNLEGTPSEYKKDDDDDLFIKEL